MNEVLLAVDRVPRSCQKLYRSQQEACHESQSGRLDIRLCGHCGLAWNRAFQGDADQPQFDEHYYCSLSSSQEGRSHQTGTADQLDRVLDVSGKSVLEIGCGDGFFLGELARLGATCLGYEPSATSELAASRTGIRVVKEAFEFEGSLPLPNPVDIVVLRHVLEHLPDPRTALAALHGRQYHGSPAEFLYVEVPNLRTLLTQSLYFDFYHDHVVYFSKPALDGLLRSVGWVPVASIGGPDEFLGIVCRNDTAGSSGPPPLPGERGAIVEEVMRAATAFRLSHGRWQQELLGTLGRFREAGQRTAVWGAGSRGVALLNRLDATDGLVSYVIDSDPKKHGLFVPGVNGPIRAPEYLRVEPVHNVMISSFTYFDEIARGLRWFVESGGRLIQPYPIPRMVEGAWC